MNIRRRSSGFTLIELLVVISIIALLAGLGMSGIQSAMKAAKKAQANALMSQVRTAVTAYSTEYGRLPIPDTYSGSDYTLSESDEWRDMVIMLSGNRDPVTGQNVSSPRISNSREIVFFEFKKQDLDGNGALRDPTFPPKAPGFFVMLLDGDYDTSIEVPADPLCKNLSTVTQVNSSVAIYSRVGASNIEKPENALVSW